MKRILLVACLLALGACSYSKVPAGNVGIMVDLYGSDKGVQAKELGVGRYWVGVNQELYLFPTYTQTRSWTEGNKEAITFNDKDGQVIGTDYGVTYHIEPDKASVLFQKYRNSLDEITDVNLHNMLRDAFSERASKMSIEEIYGSHKADLVAGVQLDVQEQVAAFGIVLEKVYLINHMRLPPSIDTAINAKANAVQIAAQKQTEVIQAQADAAKAVAKANGEAQSKLVIAEAEAKAIKLKADSLRESGALVQWQAVDKWDGHLPQVSGGSTPFINLPAAK